MAKRSKRQLIGWRSLSFLLRISFSASVYRSLALFVAVLLLSSVEAQATSVSIAQQPATSSPNATTTDEQQTYEQGLQLIKQGQQLEKQGTVESQQQALAKYEEALSIWQQLAVNEAPPYEARSWEALTLSLIGTIYDGDQDEPQKALDYFERGLAVRRELKNRLQDAIARASMDNAGSNSNDKQKLLDTYKQALAFTNVEEASLLNSLGGVYFELGKKQEALEYYRQALSLLRAEKKPSREADTLSFIANVYFQSGETQSSLNFYNQALEIQRAEKDIAAQARTLGTIGIIYIQLGELQQALAIYKQALELQRERKDFAGQADILGDIGWVYFKWGHYQKALDFHNQALKLWQAAQGNLSGTDLAFNFTQQAEILRNIGLTYSLGGFGDLAKALDFFNQARSLYQKAGYRYGEATLLSYISNTYKQLGEMQKALDALNQALMLCRAISSPTKEAVALRDIAGIYESMDEPQQALDFYNQALEIQRRVNDRPQQAATLNSIAKVYSSLGDYQLSIDTHNQALEIFKSIGNLTNQALTLTNIGGVYQGAKNYEKALEFHNQSLALAKQNNDFPQQVTTLVGIASVYLSLKDYPKALDAANQILALSREQNNPSWEAYAFGMSGVAYLKSADYQKALEALEKAVAADRKVEDHQGEATHLRDLGKVYNALKQYEKALSTYDRVLALRRMFGDRTEEAYTLYEVAITQRDKGNLNAARTQIEAAIKIVEDIRTRVTSPELRTSYFASVQNYYQFYIDVLMQLHKKEPYIGYDALALHASERARARSLLELLTEANANIRQGVEPKQLEQERTLQQKLDAVEKRRVELHSSNPTKGQLEKIERERENLLEEYRQAQADIRAKSPRYAALTQPKPLTLAEIQQQVLDDDTLLLEYSLGEERSYLWAVTKTGITSYQLPKRAEIELAARGFYDLLNTPGYRLETRKPIDNQRGIAVELAPANTEVVTKLSQMLLGQVAGKLDKKRLLIVSEGALQYVPFAALPVPTQPSTENNANPSTSPTPLLVNYEIVNLPSASTLAVLRQEQAGRKPAAKAVAVLADPVFGSDDERVNQAKGQTEKPQSIGENLALSALARSARESDVTFKRLPFTRQEAEEILSLVPAAERKQAFDFAANRAFATNPELSQYRIVHFATHGILNSVHPELSGVVLSLLDEKGESQNGFLRLHDVFNLNLPAELVVLSACETGLGEEVKGEGLVGLTRGFMYAGTPRVVVSLWSVSDRATSELMTKFYKGMLEKNLQPAAALRAAQIDMWQKTEWKAPYYWAAFVLQGEWK
ncbi:CHAT domain-containing protein [Coleofasciculus sp. FACHB-129]|uniref:CHAT domain-containing protein n=1 Tax=Cyanophyceae TaxID=3028117 RepID=UPI0016875E3F|nr:CHAT domain-containing protein [Coleofasciculus sp. FACHB-129]MBD1895198.1 tetratricopeptide repeat protein [Coleofasciculus sp. FACHB-129]